MWYFFKDPIQHPFSGFLEKCAHIIISSQTSITHIIAEQSRARINYVSYHQQGKAWFKLIIEKLSYSAIVLCNNFIYNLLTAEESTEKNIQNVSNKNSTINDLMKSFYRWLIGQLKSSFIISSSVLKILSIGHQSIDAITCTPLINF